jgi:hypothetical protein
MNKRGWRTAPVVDTNNTNRYNVDPLDIAANMDRVMREKFEKAAVQPTSSIYDQITSIINNVKPKFPSVEAAVQDMQERSGFTSYQREKNNFVKMKQAQSQETEQSKSSEPSIFKEHPEIKETFDNYINDTRGNLSVPAVIDRVKSIHRHDVDDISWSDEALVEYVDAKCHDAKSHNPMPEAQGLGHVTHFNDTTDVDPSNRDAFFSLNPSKASVKTASVEGQTLLQAIAAFDGEPKDVKCDELTWLPKEDRAELKGWGTAKSVKGNPPKWVASEKTWDKAKKAVKKYWKAYEEPYGVVAWLYHKQMGGKIKKPKKK